MQVTSGRPTKVCVTDGHGEWTLDAGVNATWYRLQGGCSSAAERIVLETLLVRAARKAFRKECDAIFVLGPQRPSRYTESAALEALPRSRRQFS